MSDDKMRLFKLIEHWVQHNEEHRKRFVETSAEAELMNLEGVAGEMRLAAEKSGEVSEYLLKALKYLEEKNR